MSEHYRVEVTDTFGGEASYCWVERYALTLPDGASRAQIMRAAKRAADYSGCRGRVEDFGGDLAFYPRGGCTVMFVTFDRHEPELTRDDWAAEVANGDTVRGFADWMAAQKEQAQD